MSDNEQEQVQEQQEQVEETQQEETQQEETQQEEQKEEPKAEEPKSCGGCKCPLDWESALEALKKPFQGVKSCEEVHNILHWTVPVNSAIAFVVLNVIATFCIRYKYNFLTVVFLGVFFLLLAALIFEITRVIAYFKGDKNGESRIPKDKFPDHEKYLNMFFGFTEDVIKAVANLIKEVLLVEDVLLSVCFVPGCLILAFIFQKLDVLFLAYLILVFLFIWCPVYDRFQAQIDNAFESLKKIIKDACDKAKNSSEKPKAE